DVVDPPAISNGMLLDATQHAPDPYSDTITMAGGVAPFTFTATGLPPGLTLNTNTGVISGTATTLGASSVAIVATDKNGKQTSASLSLVVNPPVAITTTILRSPMIGRTYSEAV